MDMGSPVVKTNCSNLIPCSSCMLTSGGKRRGAKSGMLGSILLVASWRLACKHIAAGTGVGRVRFSFPRLGLAQFRGSCSWRTTLSAMVQEVLGSPLRSSISKMPRWTGTKNGKSRDGHTLRRGINGSNLIDHKTGLEAQPLAGTALPNCHAYTRSDAQPKLIR